METTKYAIIDCRVSDPQQLKGGSLEDQEVIGRATAMRYNATVAHVFRKPHSATTTERDDLDEVIDFIKKYPHQIHYYIFKCIDRFTRAGYPEYERRKAELEKLGVQIIDSYGVIQPIQNTLDHLGQKYKWSMYSPSEIAEMISAYQGKAEAREILTRMVGAEIRLVQEGFAVRRAPDGLHNKRIFINGKDRVIREAGEKAHYFQKMYELRADGIDDTQIVNILNATGFKTNIYTRWDRSDPEHPRKIGTRGGKVLTVKQMQRYLLQTEYAGVSCEKWNKHKPVRTQYFDGIVSIDTFNRANRGKVYIKVSEGDEIEVLYNYSPWGRVKRLRDNPMYPWKCIACPFCNKSMLGSPSTGKSGAKFHGYHCGGSKSGDRAHEYFRLDKKTFESNVKNYLDSLKFEDGFLAGLELHLLSEYREREKEVVLESSAISRTVSDLKAELAQKLEAFGFAESPITRKMIEQQIAELDEQIKGAESQRMEIEVNEKSIRVFVRYAKYVMEHPAEILTEACDLQGRRALLGLFFEQTPTYNEILNGTPKLTALFKLSEEFKGNKTQLVTLRGIEPRFKP
ncbi:MAG: recombinase family protein [Candidatus Vogelbacteria bacterium]|nr:recombinase family protein [Candidatus Vogelbacteria bacterium]